MYCNTAQELFDYLSELKEKTGSIKEVLDRNFHSSEFVPYTGYNNMLYMKRVEELTGLPMGQQIFIDNNGETISRPSSSNCFASSAHQSLAVILYMESQSEKRNGPITTPKSGT